MVECRNCRGYFRTTPDKIGARCPKCRAPLFERADRHKPGESVGACAAHPGVDSMASCQRCHVNICQVCRTKWHGEVLCPTCVELSMSRAEPNPKEMRKQGMRAVWSVTLALVGWIILAIAVAMVAARREEASLTAPIVFSVLSVIPAFFAVGQSCPVLLTRGPRFSIAASGLVMSGLHLGLLLGVFLVNLWHN